MKILLSTDTFYPMINGVVISTVNLYNELKRLGHDVKILTLSHTGKERIEGDIYYLKAYKVKVYPDARVKHLIIGDLEKSIIDWKPEIIHSQTEFSTLIAARYIGKKTGAVHLHTYHTMYEEYLNYLFKGKLIRPRMVGKLVNVLLNRMDAVIVPTQKMKDCLIRFKIERPIYVVPTGLNIYKFQKRITEQEKSELIWKYGLQNSRVLVYVGRVAEEKNIDEVIRYYSKAALEIEGIKLLVVGGGPYLDKLKDLVDKLNIAENVIFTGMINPEEIYKYYQLGEIFVTSSTSETQGLTYIEALASGTPVVCRKDPCIDGLIVNGVDGYTFENEQEFVKSIQNFLYNEIHRKNAAAAGEKKAREYSSELFGQRINEVYETVNTIDHKTKKVNQLYKVNNIFGRIF